MPFDLKGVIVWFKQIKPIWVLELKLFGSVFVQNQMYIQYCIYTSTFAQIKSVKVGWLQTTQFFLMPIMFI
jgi:hypothetical protein